MDLYDSLRDAYPIVSTLMGAYFHQDSDFEYGSIDGALDAFLAATTRAEKAGFESEAARMIAASDVHDLERTLRTMGNTFDYRSGGYDARTWLESLVARVRSS